MYFQPKKLTVLYATGKIFKCEYIVCVWTSCIFIYELKICTIIIKCSFSSVTQLAITFLPRSKCLLISWLQSPSAVILEPKNIKSATVSTASPFTCHEVMGPDAMILVFWMLSFKPTFSLSSSTTVVKTQSIFHWLWDPVVDQSRKNLKKTVSQSCK